MATEQSPAATEKQIAEFIAKFDAPMAKFIRAARAAMRRRLPTSIELVYDNYNFLVMGFATTERASDCIASIAANAKGIILSFYWGSSLPDPQKLLQGSGTQNRFLRLASAEMIADPAVEALLAAAIEQGKNPLPASGQGCTIIRSICEKQRPRRATPPRTKATAGKPRRPSSRS